MPAYHLLDCDFCAVVSEPLFDRRAKRTPTSDGPECGSTRTS